MAAFCIQKKKIYYMKYNSVSDAWKSLHSPAVLSTGNKRADIVAKHVMFLRKTVEINFVQEEVCNF
jgi:hypothetical protein